MDLMFANLLGIKPAEIKEAVEKTMAAIQGAAKDIEEIKQRLNSLEMYFNRREHVNGGYPLISDNRTGEQLNGDS